MAEGAVTILPKRQSIKGIHDTLPNFTLENAQNQNLETSAPSLLIVVYVCLHQSYLPSTFNIY